MRHSFLAVFVLAAAACVDVPDSVRAQFAGPGAADRSNYRHGLHGSAPPAEEPPVAKAADATVLEPATGPDAGVSPTVTGDGGAEAPTTSGPDGGVS